jgi:hypothetical protein
MGTRRPNRRSSISLGKDGIWHGWVTVGVKADGSADRRHRKGRTEAEVTRKVRELESQRESGYVSKPGRAPSLAEWMTEYLDVLCERLVLSEKMAPRTLADYRSKTRNWIVRYWASIGLTGLRLSTWTPPTRSCFAVACR